jgi:outer membrane receptor protein involved in Fe transport
MIYNVGLSYERYGLSTSLSWQYRTEWLDSLGDGDILGDGYWDEVGRLDFRVSYAFNDNAEVYFDANNLLDEPGIRYQGASWRVSEFERFGARYMIGMRLNF